MMLSFRRAILLSLLLRVAGGQECVDSYATCRTRKTFEITTNLDEYYSSTIDLSGTNLKSALNSIIKGHNKYNYDCVWTALGEIDADQQNSDNVIAIYTQNSISRLNRDGCTLTSGERNYSPDAWNREHLWPKSHGFPKQSQHAYTDLHHLVPADKSVNTDRSHNDFKDGGSAKVCKEDDLCCEECKEDNINKTWEPPQEVKGQIARMMLYMDVRYEGTDEEITKTPDLKLVDESTQDKNPDPDLTYYPELGYLSNLLKWHCENPVSEREIQRNNAVQSWQGNRNPFIDRPDFARAIWNGAEFASIWESCDEGSSSWDTSVWINEFHYDNSGTDINEFVEIACNKEVDLTGYQIILFNGKNGLPYGDPAVLSGICSPPNQFIVKKYSTNGMQNGHDGIALFDSQDEVLEFISYEGTFTIASELFEGVLEADDVGVSESSSTKEGYSLQKVGQGCAGNDFNWKPPSKESPGKINNEQFIDCSL